jgi:predicted nucleic acid-binding protein
MIFDTDVLIWFFRGNQKAVQILEAEAARSISIVTLMELYQGARSHTEVPAIRAFFHENSFRVLPINETISHLAATLVEEHALKHGVRLADALIAATARETASVLVTGNVRHFRAIPALQLRQFRPA